MTAEEAALRLSDEAHQFLVFRDADTSRLGVIYKRNDGNYGLIEPVVGGDYTTGRSARG